MSVTTASWFGKLPQHREYIARGERRLGEIGMREWLDGGVQLARSDLGHEGKRHLENLPTLRFVWPGGRGAYTAGCIDRGGDAAGRGYPFVIFGDLGQPVRDAVRLPARVGGLCAALAALVDRAREAPDIAAAESVLGGGVAHAPGDDPDAACAAYLSTPIGAALAAPPDAGEWPSRHQLVQGVVEALGVFRGQPLDRLRVGLRFRLTPGASIDLETCFWLALAAGVLGTSALADVTVLWTPGGVEYPPSAFLFFRPPTASQFLGVLDFARDVQSISCTDVAYDAQPPENRMQPSLRALVDDDATTLDALVRAVADHKG